MDMHIHGATEVQKRLIRNLQKEAAQLEESATLAAEAHFRSASRWGKTHLGVGIPSTLISASAGGAAFNDYSMLAAGMAIGATMLTGLLTFLKPSEWSEKHKIVATRYRELANRARVFRTISILEMSPDEAKRELMKLEQVFNELEAAAPVLLRENKAYELSAQLEMEMNRNRRATDRVDGASASAGTGAPEEGHETGYSAPSS